MNHLSEILNLYGFNEIESQNLLLALDLVNCNVNIDSSFSLQQELEALDAALQTCFLRPQDTERQQLHDKFKDEELRSQLIPLLSPFIQTIASGNDIPVKMLLGAAENGTKERFNILVELEKNSHHTDTIYLLGGERDLWIDYEPMASTLLVERLTAHKNISKEEAELELKNAIDEFFPDKTNIATKRSAIVKHFTEQGIIWPNEADMMARLAPTYKELANTKFILVSAPMKLNDKGQLVRPDTLDTFNQFWLDHSTSILESTNDGTKYSMSIVTTQPFGTYQQQQAISAFHSKPINIFVVAGGIKNTATMNIATAFDSFARTIYAGKNVVSKNLDKIKIEQNPEL
jgi:hypothetical protein